MANYSDKTNFSKDKICKSIPVAYNLCDLRDDKGKQKQG